MKCIIYICAMKGSKTCVQSPIKLPLLQPLWWQRDRMFSQALGQLETQPPGQFCHFMSCSPPDPFRNVSLQHILSFHLTRINKMGLNSKKIQAWLETLPHQP